MKYTHFDDIAPNNHTDFTILYFAACRSLRELQAAIRRTNGGKENNGLIKTDGKGVYMVRKPDELKTDLQHELFNQYKAKWQQWEKEYETE